MEERRGNGENGGARGRGQGEEGRERGRGHGGGGEGLLGRGVEEMEGRVEQGVGGRGEEGRERGRDKGEGGKLTIVCNNEGMTCLHGV